ncbi:MAG: deoxyribodipyrimidine photo-lyase [Arenicella sp.]|jgi:deoxyribodipyrimidine photo-lyase
MNHNIIVWFRNDLRLEDNVTLFKASEKSKNIIPVYCFDPNQFGVTSLGFPKTGSFRTKFLLESVMNLKESLQAIGSDLLIRVGEPQDVILELAKNLRVKSVFASKEITSEEVGVEKALENALFSEQIDLELIWQSTLYHIEDLPFPVRNLPDIFTQFRKKVEKMAAVRDVLPTPAALKMLPSINLGELPTFKELGFDEEPMLDARTAIDFRGGETEAQKRLQHYFWETDSLKNYKETRNGLLGADYSSKFSPWLALGCISPRFISEKIREYEADRFENDSTYWLLFELIWRDYFKFVAKKYGNSIFKEKGTKNLKIKFREDCSVFKRWVDGQTGVPFIDANMKELKRTGFMSNRGRQNVASFLVKDLNINWTWGAEYFESQLVDYDACSNWCNWNYVAGVGNDPRENRYFNILRQAENYDSKGNYVKHWLPELSAVPEKVVHEAGSFDKKLREEYDIKSYPESMVDFNKWKKVKAYKK